MAASITSLGISFDTNAGNHTVTATPALNDLIFIVAANTGRTTAQAPTITDNNSDGLGTYVLVVSATANTSADSLWIFVRERLIGSATSTIFTATQSGDSGGGLNVCKVTGMNKFGAGAIRAVGSQNNQAAATPAPAFPQAALTTNGVAGAIFNATNPATMTPPTSWVESQDVGYATPTTGLEVAYRNSGATTSTITWGSASASAFCSVIIELDVALQKIPSLLIAARIPAF